MPHCVTCKQKRKISAAKNIEIISQFWPYFSEDMPPVRRQNAATQQRAGNVNQPSVNDLRQQCLDKGLSDHCLRNTLVARLQQHASTSSSNSNATELTEVEARVEQTALETPKSNRSSRGQSNNRLTTSLQTPIELPYKPWQVHLCQFPRVSHNTAPNLRLR
jgi:hypothetical protein